MDKDPPVNEEDPTCPRATKPMRLCSRARELQILSPLPAITEVLAPRTGAAQREATAAKSQYTTTKSSPRSPQVEKTCTKAVEDPVQSKKINKQTVAKVVFEGPVNVQEIMSGLELDMGVSQGDSPGVRKGEGLRLCESRETRHKGASGF